MDQARASGLPENALFGALELSKDSWLLAIQFPDHQQPSLYPIKGGNATGLTEKLLAARDRWAKVSGEMPSITLCYEAGYDAFWLARFLEARGIACLVVDSASLQVNRRSRRAKTDRIDVRMLLRALIAWCRGERHVWSVVRIPNVDEEDLRRSHRERSRLVVAPINPICRRNPSIPGLCRIASPTCARPFELSLPWSVRLSSAARRCILRTLPCDSSLPP